MFSSFRLRPELSLCMRSSFHSNLPGKLSKCKTTVQNFHTVKILGPKYPTPLLILILRLAAPCHRITPKSWARWALRVTLIAPGLWHRDLHDLLRQQSENFIFKVENLMNYEVLGCLSRFCHFLNSGWFWHGFSMNFESPSSFRARGWLQITESLKFYQKSKFH